MTDQAISFYEDYEISLPDILATLAESWKLLVFSPLIAKVLAGALSFLWPKTFSLWPYAADRRRSGLAACSHVLDPLIGQCCDYRCFCINSQIASQDKGAGAKINQVKFALSKK